MTIPGMPGMVFFVDP